MNATENNPTTIEATDRNSVIARIRTALKQRSGKSWSVCGGRGTAWGWITISAPPARRLEFGYMSDSDRVELAQLLGLSSAHMQGVDIPSSSDHYREFIDRAEGRTPRKIAEQYWD